MSPALTGQIALLSEARNVLRLQEQAMETRQLFGVTLQACKMHHLHEGPMDLLPCRKTLLKVGESSTSRSMNTWQIVEQEREKFSLCRTRLAVFIGRIARRQFHCGYKARGSHLTHPGRNMMTVVPHEACIVL